MKIFLRKMMCVGLIGMINPIFCMNQAIVPTSTNALGMSYAMPLAFAAVQVLTQASSVSTAPQSPSKRVYLKCGESSPEQISWAINENFLKIQKGSLGYNVRVNVNAYYLLNNTTVDTARSVLSLFNKQHPIFHDSDCIDAVRKQNVYFNGLVSIILTDFCNEVQEVNGLTLDALLLGKGKQPIPLIIDEYIHEKARKCYDKPIYNMPFNKDLGFILVHDPIFRTKLYGQGHEIIPGSVQVSNDDCYIKAEDTAGHVLVWDISTGERVALSSPQTYWTPMADHVPSVNNGVTNESKKCMAVVVKDKKITYQENDFLFEDNYSQDGQVPALILVVKPTWHDEIIYTALMKSYSVEQHQALLKSKSLRLMHPFVRANLKAYLRYILQSWENNAELVQ